MRENEGKSEMRGPGEELAYGNRLLAEFPDADRERLAAGAESVLIPAGDVICDPGQTPRHVDFPNSGVLSWVVSLANGSVVEAAMIGNEGMTGIAALFNAPATPLRIVQRMEGESLRVSVEDFQEVLTSSPAVRAVLGRYALTLFQQCAQNAACNLHHRLEERMCRWLIATADRGRQLELRITQEYLSEMLGVSRQSVNAAAGTLQNRGLISYRRGRLAIVDRGGLEAAACECYASTRGAYRRLMRAP